MVLLDVNLLQSKSEIQNVFLTLPTFHKITASTWILAANDVCFSATSFVNDSTFTAPYSGDVVSVKLVHTSGGVACSMGYDTTLTNWGCHATSGDWLKMQLVHHNDDLTVDTVLPTTSTMNVTSLTEISCGAGCSVNNYVMDGVDVSAAEMTWKDSLAMLSVTTQDKFSLQYGEGCCGSSTGDNSGTSCADVYFKYGSSSMSTKQQFSLSTICNNTKLCLVISIFNLLSCHYR